MPMEDLLTRQAPHSQEAEQSVLGSMLIDSRCISDGGGGGRPEEGHRNQVVHRPGGLAVPVDELIQHVHGVLLGLHLGDAAVHVQPQAQAVDVALGDVGLHLQILLARLGLRAGGLLALHQGHRLV